MKTYLQKNIVNLKFIEKFTKLLIFFIPVSLILGNAVLNINSFLIILLLFFLGILNKKFFLNYKKIFIIFSFFFILLVLNIIFSINQSSSIISALGIVRYFFLMIAILYCLETDENFLVNFSKYLFLILTFVALDTLYQYFFGQDIFGIKNTSSHGQRLNGPFGNEYVVGSYLSKLFFISLSYLIIKKKSFKILFLYLIFILFITLLTKERMASLMLVSTCLIFLFFLKNLEFKKKLIVVISFLILTSSLIYKNQSIKNHLVFRTLDQLGIATDSSQKKIILKQDKRIFFDSQWGAHFLTAYNIFLDNPVFGTGIKTFRKECGNSKYDKINSSSVEIRCNTHPHNIYLEIISEGGLILFISFVLLNIYLFYKLILNIFIKKINVDLSLLTFCSFLLLFSPFQTTGSFFSTWNGFYYWLIYAFIIFVLNEKNDFNNKKFI